MEVGEGGGNPAQAPAPAPAAAAAAPAPTTAPRRTRARRRRRQLRKRRETHGHGTLNDEDVEDAKDVDLANLDIKAEEIGLEFGAPGLLPARHQVLREHFLSIKRKGAATLEYEVTEGRYKLEIRLVMSPKGLGDFLGDRRRLLCKVWLQNKTRRCSLSSVTKTMQTKNGVLCFDFEATHREQLAVLVTLTSQCRLSTVKVSSTLTKLP